MDLEQAAEELYGIDPATFVARRTELVKQARAAKDRPLATAIGALRRPTVSAWYLNLAARAPLPELGELLQLGAEMREAQARLDMAAVAGMTGRRRELEQAVLTGLTRLLETRGVTASAASLAEVQSTLTAAVADPRAEQVVTSGCLARPLVYAGFGEVDLTGALGAELDLRTRQVAEDRAPAAAATPAASAATGGETPADEDAPAALPSGEGRPHLRVVPGPADEPVAKEAPPAAPVPDQGAPAEPAPDEPAEPVRVTAPVAEEPEPPVPADDDLDDEEAAALAALEAAQKALAAAKAKKQRASAAKVVADLREQLLGASTARVEAEQQVERLSAELAAAQQRLEQAQAAEAELADRLVAAEEQLG